MFACEKIGAGEIYLATGDERDGISHTGTALDVARRDRLAATRAHSDPAAGGVSGESFQHRKLFYFVSLFVRIFVARENNFVILRAR
jgi:hypothetical protein